MVSKFYENHKDRQASLNDKRREVYQNLIMPYRSFLLNSISKKGDDTSSLTEEQISTAVNAAFDAIMFGSDSVLKAYGVFRNMTLQDNHEPVMTLKGLANLLQAIRKDLGNNFSTVDEVDILKMFINIDKSYEDELRGEFKKIIL